MNAFHVLLAYLRRNVSTAWMHVCISTLPFKRVKSLKWILSFSKDALHWSEANIEI